MKKVHLIALVMVLAALGIILQSSGLLFGESQDFSTYGTFEEARTSGKTVKIAGQLSKDKDMVYDPVKDPNFFTFFIKDTKGEEHQVVLHGAKPQDFEKSEQIVVTGRLDGDQFIASDLLMKCPSKYKDEEVYIKSKEG